MGIEWLAAWPQAGDATEYLLQGEACAYDGQCFNTLRPVISTLWFSLPYRLGLPPTAILALHALLLFFSIALAASIMIRLAGKSERLFRLQQVISILFSSTIHALFFWPTFFHSLSDAPAALLMLCATFLLIRLQMNATKFRGIGYCLIGLLLGLAEGLRIFYLYPLLAFLALYLGASLLAPNRDWRALYLLSALLPVALQNYATFLYSGEITHMPSTPEMRFWSDMHRSSTYTGYDTLIPEQGYPWFKSPCAVTQGIGPSWNKNDWRQLSCLIAGRVYFLLGSYSPQTYLELDVIPPGDYNIIGNPIRTDKANWADPYSEGGETMQASTAPGDNFWQINIAVQLPATPVTFALTTQSAEPSTQLKMHVQTQDGQIVAEQWLPMTAEPTRHFLHANISVAGSYSVNIGAGKERPAPFVFQIGDFRITPTAVEEPFPADPSKVRFWSPPLLGIQAAIILVYIVVALKRSAHKPQWLAIAALPLLVIAQSPIVIPEQRFIIFAEICFWLVAATTFMHYTIAARHPQPPTV